jgi:hypothetical protein
VQLQPTQVPLQLQLPLQLQPEKQAVSAMWAIWPALRAGLLTKAANLPRPSSIASDISSATTTQPSRMPLQPLGLRSVYRSPIGAVIAVPSESVSQSHRGCYRSPIGAVSQSNRGLYRSPIGSPIGTVHRGCIGTEISAVPPPSAFQACFQGALNLKVPSRYLQGTLEVHYRPPRGYLGAVCVDGHQH